MGTLFIVVLVCLLVACIVGVGAFAWLGYGRVKAGFNIGCTGFYIEADDLSVQPSGGAPDIAGRGVPRTQLTRPPPVHAGKVPATGLVCVSPAAGARCPEHRIRVENGNYHH